MSSDFGFTTRWLDRIKRVKLKPQLNHRELFKPAGFSTSGINRDQLSESQLTKYDEILEKAIKSNFYYRQKIEHVTPDLGFEYKKKINDLNPNFLKRPDPRKYFDNIGNPLTYEYTGLGRISPTTLRYLAMAFELKFFFGDLNNRVIGEIEVGHGGRIKTLDTMYELKKHYACDRSLAQSLTKKYLSRFTN